MELIVQYRNWDINRRKVCVGECGRSMEVEGMELIVQHRNWDINRRNVGGG